MLVVSRHLVPSLRIFLGFGTTCTRPALLYLLVFPFASPPLRCRWALGRYFPVMHATCFSGIWVASVVERMGSSAKRAMKQHGNRTVLMAQISQSKVVQDFFVGSRFEDTKDGIFQRRHWQVPLPRPRRLASGIFPSRLRSCIIITSVCPPCLLCRKNWNQQGSLAARTQSRSSEFSESCTARWHLQDWVRSMFQLWIPCNETQRALVHQRWRLQWGGCCLTAAWSVPACMHAGWKRRTGCKTRLDGLKSSSCTRFKRQAKDHLEMVWIWLPYIAHPRGPGLKYAECMGNSKYHKTPTVHLGHSKQEKACRYASRKRKMWNGGKSFVQGPTAAAAHSANKDGSNWARARRQLHAKAFAESHQT